MLRLLLISTIFSGSLLWGANAKRVAGYGNLPLRFEPNRGQTDGEARFLARGNGYALFLTQSGAVLSLKGGSALRMSLAGGRGGVLQGSDGLGGASNYFIGNDRAKWVTDVPHYGKVRHEGAWEGVDVVYYGNQGKLEYDFVVAPGADPGRIRLRFEGQKALRIDAGGDLVLTLPGGGEMRQLAAVVYQETGGRRTAIRGRYVLRGRGEVSVAVDEYDRSKPLVVDPVLVYSTYLGGSGFDSGNAIAVDSAGNAYVAGGTESADFPKVGPRQGAIGGSRDAFVSKLNPAGTALVYSTFLGGTSSDEAFTLGVDSSGNAYVGGRTSSGTSFPLQSPLYSAGSSFISKLNASGNGLAYATLFPGTLGGLAIDPTGAAVLTGYISSGLPLVNAYQTIARGRDEVFVSKLNPQGTALMFSTYLGGTGDDDGRSVAIDTLGNVWVAGITQSTDFPTLAPRQGGNAGNQDAFVSKWSSSGQLLFCTLLGGSGWEELYGIATDPAGNAFVTGYTQSADFPMRNAYQSTKLFQSNAFVTGYRSTGEAYIFSTYLGGSTYDAALGIASGPDGSVTVVGEVYATSSTSDFPLISPIQRWPGYVSSTNTDGFVAQFTGGGTLIFSTFLGGVANDSAVAVAVDQTGNIFVAGRTASNEFPVSAAGLQLAKTGSTDGFITKIDLSQQCQYGISSGLGNFSSMGGSGSFAITTAAGCYWAVLSPANWITITSGARGFGNGTVNYTVAANSNATSAQTPRFSTLLLTSGDGFPVRQDGSNVPCPALPISIGQTITATLSDTGNCTSIGGGHAAVQYYFTAVAGQQIAVDANSSAVYPYISLYGPNAQQIATDSHGPSCNGFPFCTCSSPDPHARIPGGPNSAAFYTIPTAGVYLINVTSGGNSNCADYTGTFTLKLLAPVPPLLRFVAMPPCRVMETRSEYNFEGRTGSFGPPYLTGGSTRTLAMTTSNVCSIPSRAKAYVLNLTVVPRGGGGVDSVTVFPAGDTRPNFHSIRSPDALVVANSAIVKAGNSNGISVYTSNDTDMLIDINGYFTDDTAVPNLVYYPLTPCRVIDTRVDYRSPAGPFGPPTMERGETRRFRFPATPYCTVPAGAAAYSVTLTAVPPQPLAFITAWPSGQSQPNVSNINSVAGRTLANNIVVPASADGSIDVFAYDRTDFIIDINGYFAPDNGSGLYYTPVPQCRILDTAGNGFTGAFGAPAMGNDQTRTIPVVSATTCSGLSANAKAWVVNATALPGGSPMPFLTMFPTGTSRPNASQLNAFNGQVVTNTAIVPAGANGSIDVYTYRQTNLLLDISGYFGR